MEEVVLIIIIWLLFLTFAIVYLFVMNHLQQNINDSVDEALEMLIDDINH